MKSIKEVTQTIQLEIDKVTRQIEHEQRLSSVDQSYIVMLLRHKKTLQIQLQSLKQIKIKND